MRANCSEACSSSMRAAIPSSGLLGNVGHARRFPGAVGPQRIGTGLWRTERRNAGFDQHFEPDRRVGNEKDRQRFVAEVTMRSPGQARFRARHAPTIRARTARGRSRDRSAMAASDGPMTSARAPASVTSVSGPCPTLMPVARIFRHGRIGWRQEIDTDVGELVAGRRTAAAGCRDHADSGSRPAAGRLRPRQSVGCLDQRLEHGDANDAEILERRRRPGCLR